VLENEVVPGEGIKPYCGCPQSSASTSEGRLGAKLQLMKTGRGGGGRNCIPKF
jgi:hypothetical protein